MFAACTNLYADIMDMKPYIGIDAQIRHMNFTKGFGDNLFRNIYPQCNTYLGVKFNDYFGIELGYQASKKQTRIVSLNTGAINLGTAVPAPASPVVFASDSKIQGAHINLVAFYPTYSDELELFASIGVGRLKAQFTRFTISIGNGPVPSSLPTTFKFTQSQTVARINTGFQKMISDCIGFRGTIGWENTSRFKAITSSPITRRLTEIRLKNSIVYSLGIFANF